MQARINPIIESASIGANSEEFEKVITFSNEMYRVSKIRQLKIFREISENKQKRLTEWDF